MLGRVQRTPTIVGQKRPLKLKHVWAIRVRLDLAENHSDLALFNMAIDSMLRGRDLVKMKIVDSDGPVGSNLVPGMACPEPEVEVINLIASISAQSEAIGIAGSFTCTDSHTAIAIASKQTDLPATGVLRVKTGKKAGCPDPVRSGLFS